MFTHSQDDGCRKEAVMSGDKDVKTSGLRTKHVRNRKKKNNKNWRVNNMSKGHAWTFECFSWCFKVGAEAPEEGFSREILYSLYNHVL